MERKFIGFWSALTSVKGCKKVLAICIAIILVASCCASLIAHSGNDVVISDVYFDARGAVINAELYTPNGVGADDSLPAVIVAHGGSCSYGIMSGISQELARRGFVVLNVSAYGCGSSEYPKLDDSGSAPGTFSSPRGIYDALNYLRTLKYVDQSRIGLTGHSMGGVRTGAAGAMDGSWLTLNDLLINALCENFGLELTEEEIYQDADALAEKYLDASELNFYEKLKAEETDFYNNRVKAVLALGIGTNAATLATQTVEVGGYEVQRMLNVNVGCLTGRYDELVAGMSYPFDTSLYNNSEGAALAIGRDCFQTGGEPAEEGAVYVIDTTFQSGNSVNIGKLADLSIVSDEALSDAIENRSLRFFYLSNETHSQNFLSVETTGMIVKFFEQTLSYNNGELMDSNTTPIDYTNIVWLWREALNCVAMFAMWAMLFPIASLLLKSPAFADVAMAPAEPRITKKSKKFWIISVFLALANIFAVIYVGGWTGLSSGATIVGGSWFFPYEGTPAKIFGWIIVVCVASVIALLVGSLVDKNSKIKDFITDYGINIGIVKWLKTLAISFVIFFFAYVSVEFLQRVMNMDYRLWMVGFDVMNTQQMFATIRYVLPLAVLFAISGVVINSGRMKDMTEGKNMALNLFFTGVGLIVLAIINYAIAVSQNINAPTSFYLSCFGLVLMVLVNGYINRKMFNMTGSVWLGAFTNAWLVAWLWCSMCDSSFLIR